MLDENKHRHGKQCENLLGLHHSALSYFSILVDIIELLYRAYAADNDAFSTFKYILTWLVGIEGRR